MSPEQIAAKVGQQVTEEETVDLIRSTPIGTSPNDVAVRSGVLQFSFGRGGVKLMSVEQRIPLPVKPAQESDL